MQGMFNSYSKIKNLFFVLNGVFTLLFFFIMSYSFSRSLRELVNRFTGNTIIVITIYFLLFYFFYFLFIFALRYFEGFVLENRMNHKKQKFRKWLRGLINKEIITFVFLLIGVQVVYFFLETKLDTWWVSMAVLSIFALNAGQLLSEWLVPYYSRHKDLDDRQLQARLNKLAERAGMEFSRILVYKDSRAKAVVFGVKRSRTLLLSNILLDYAVEEIDVLVAMEIAKLRNGYVWKKVLMEATGMFVAYFIIGFAFAPICEKFGFEFIFDVETLPVLLGLFSIVSLAVWGILNHFKRDMEREKDEYVLRLSKAPEAFVSLIVRDSQQNIKGNKGGDFFKKFFSSQIPVPQRIMLAQDFAQDMLFESSHRENLNKREKK